MLQFRDLAGDDVLATVGYSGDNEFKIINQMIPTLQTDYTLGFQLVGGTDDVNMNKLQMSSNEHRFLQRSGTTTYTRVNALINDYVLHGTASSVGSPGVNRLSFAIRDGTVSAHIGSNTNGEGNVFDLQLLTVGHTLRLRTRTGGTNRSALESTPSTDTRIYHPATSAQVFRTVVVGSGGVEIDNQATGAGFERVLTTGDLAAGGGAGISGVPVNNQLAVWTGASDIEGDANITWDGSELRITAGVMRIAERAASLADVAGFGQIWVNNVPNPNTLFYTDESGTDIDLTKELWDNGTLRAQAVASGFQVEQVLLLPNNGIIYMDEQASDGADIANQGQWWVRDDAPNLPMFSNDDGVNQILDPSVSEVNVQNGNYTLLIGDKGKTISKESGGAGETFTIPANASVAFAIGTFISFNNDGGGDLSIAITTDTLVFADDNTTGTRTLADGGYAVAQKVAATTWKIAGSGIT